MKHWLLSEWSEMGEMSGDRMIKLNQIIKKIEIKNQLSELASAMLKMS